MAAAHTVYTMIAKEEKEIDERNELIVQELPQVYFLAARIRERLPQQVDLEDLVHAGVIGLIEAYRRFDHTRNAQFKTFARFRIEGAILDSLRSLDWGSRSIRVKARDIEKAIAKLEAEQGRKPTREELAAELNLTLTALDDVQTELHGLHTVGQEAQSTFEGEAALDLIESAPSPWDNPFEMYCKTESRAHLTQAVSELTEREQLILSLYYREELTMREVAEVVGLAVSRVSQLHTAALEKLKEKLGVPSAERQPQRVLRRSA